MLEFSELARIIFERTWKNMRVNFHNFETWRFVYKYKKISLYHFVQKIKVLALIKGTVLCVASWNDSGVNSIWASYNSFICDNESEKIVCSPVRCIANITWILKQKFDRIPQTAGHSRLRNRHLKNIMLFSCT